MREAGVLSGAYLLVDRGREAALYARLKTMPAVASVTRKRAALESFQRQMDETMGMLVSFNVLFASTIAFGVVYNAARISLSERSRELASLRVLGFTRARDLVDPPRRAGAPHARRHAPRPGDGCRLRHHHHDLDADGAVSLPGRDRIGDVCAGGGRDAGRSRDLGR